MRDSILNFDPPVPLRPAGGGPPIVALDIPVVYEDEGQEEMGDSAYHTTAVGILHYGIAAHMADRPQYRVFANLNLLYHEIRRGAYISPDVMIVEPYGKLPDDIGSYRIDEDGPAPKTTVEVLSKRTGQQGDLTFKPDVCAAVGIKEYILVDPICLLLPHKLEVRRLQPDGSWTEETDPDGGITSHFGFRVIIDTDGRVRVVNAATGERYARPEEAQAEARARAEAEQGQRRAENARKHEEEARKAAEARALELEAEIERLKKLLPPENRA